MTSAIELGYYPSTFEPFKFMDYYLGDAFGAFGMTGYGKSILVGNIAVELSKSRNIIIFDYNGDYRNLKHVNIRNAQRKFSSISDLVYIHRFGFKLQDFDKPFDWEIAGMSETGARICAAKAGMREYHRNDYNKFVALIDEIPTKGKNSEMYMVKLGIKNRLKILKDVFIDKCVDITYRDVDSIRYHGIPFYISDWKYFIEAHKHICLNMNSEFNPAKAQLFAGKIMSETEVAMPRLNPVIVIEEAHKLCPNVYDEGNIPYSVIKILHYLKELHKKGVKLILISQYPHQLQDEVMDEIKHFFIGKLQNIRGSSKLDEMFKMSSSLQFNHLSGYREFLHYSPLYNEKNVFIPYDSFTYYEKRK